MQIWRTILQMTSDPVLLLIPCPTLPAMSTPVSAANATCPLKNLFSDYTVKPLPEVRLKVFFIFSAPKSLTMEFVAQATQ